MKVIRYRQQNKTGYGVLEDGVIRSFIGEPWDGNPDGPSLPTSAVQFLPLLDAPRVFGVGFNYALHTAESGRTPPAIPTLFMKPSTSVIGNGDAIIYPTGSTIVHYEGELAVIIGRRCRRVSEDDALDAVFGYSCANDISERTIQREEMKSGCMLVGKGFDTFCPIGPWIETDLDLEAAHLTTRLNGEVKQSVAAADMVFSVAKLIAWMSAALTLLPGDVILCGSPAGVGPITPGDTVEVEVTGVGVLSNPVIAE